MTTRGVHKPGQHGDEPHAWRLPHRSLSRREVLSMIGRRAAGAASTSDHRTEERLAAAVEILDRLVAFDTTSSRSNLALIDWVADYLERHGIAHTRSSAGEGKANLYATIGQPIRAACCCRATPMWFRSQGSNGRASVCFDRTRRRLHARGSADMKGFLALVLALVPEMQRQPLKVPLHIAFTHDEETGCFGAPALIRALPQSAARPMLAIVGEPTSMQIANAQKGCGFYRTRVLGQEGHSSAPGRGVNAIFAAAEIISEIAASRGGSGRSRPDSGFDPPHTTLSVGTIAGGAAVNIIARDCAFDWDMRNVPMTTPQR